MCARPLQTKESVEVLREVNEKCPTIGEHKMQTKCIVIVFSVLKSLHWGVNLCMGNLYKGIIKF